MSKDQKLKKTKKIKVVSSNAPFETAQIDRLIAERRSVKPDDFTGEEVPREVVERLLENANWAPNHGKTQPWRFFVFAGEGRKTLGTAMADIFQAVKGEEADPKKVEKLRNAPLKSSHVIAICMKRQESRKLPEVEEIEAVACAVQNLHLTAVAYGYGGYWGSGGVTYFEETKELFGLGPDDRVLGFFYLGKPKDEERKGKRRPYAETVQWVEE